MKKLFVVSVMCAALAGCSKQNAGSGQGTSAESQYGNAADQSKQQIDNAASQAQREVKDAAKAQQSLAGSLPEVLDFGPLPNVAGPII